MAAENGILIRNHPQRPPPPQDEGWSWMIMLGVFIYVFFMVGIAKSYGLFLLRFIEHFGVSVAYASMPLSLSGIVYAFSAPLAMVIADKFDAQRVVIIGAFIGTVGISISSALVSMGFVTFFFGVFYGIGNSCFYGNGLVMIGKYFNKRRSLATGLGLAGASIGQFAMPPIIEFLMETYGLSGTILIMSALYFHAAVSGALFRPLSRYGPPRQQEVPDSKADASNTKESDKQLSETKVFVKIRDDFTGAEDDESGSLEKNGDPAATSSPGSTNGKASFAVRDEEEKNPFANSDDKQSGNPVSEDATNSAKPLECNGARIEEKEKEDDDIDDEDDLQGNLAERKALFSSTGSIFLVSHSVLDISAVDDKARVFSPHSPTPARLRHEKRKALGNSINKIFDFRVLRSYITIFITLNSFISYFGYFCYILYLPGMLQEKGFAKYDKALLISLCGAGDLISRVSTGFFADLNIIPRYRISAMACILCGLNIALTLPAQGFGWLAVHCIGYGFCGGAFVCLLSVVLVDMVGLAMLSKNLAVILLIQGIGTSCGQIFLGWLRDETGSYSIIVIVSASFMILGGLMLFCYPVVRRWETARLARSGKLV